MSTPPYPLQPGPMKKSWIERNPSWKIPMGCLTLLVVIGGFVLALMTIIMASFHGSDVYKQALAKAGENPQVREQIGEPILAGWLTSGQLNVSGSTGSADLSIPISGPRGKGTIRAVASRSGGVWRFTHLQVNVDGQSSPIDLLSVQPPAEREF